MNYCYPKLWHNYFVSECCHPEVHKYLNVRIWMLIHSNCVSESLWFSRNLVRCIYDIKGIVCIEYVLVFIWKNESILNTEIFLYLFNYPYLFCTDVKCVKSSNRGALHTNRAYSKSRARAFQWYIPIFSLYRHSHIPWADPELWFSWSTFAANFKDLKRGDAPLLEN